MTQAPMRIRLLDVQFGSRIRKERFMPTMAQVLKEEIRRLARREIRISLARSRKEIATLRRALAEMRTRFAVAEADRRIQAKTVAALRPESGTGPAEPAEAGWFSSKGIRALRKRLRVTQAQFARLSGVTSQAVYTWERGGARGKLRLRKKTAAALAGLRNLGAKEAKARLEAKPQKPAAKPAKRVKVRRAARKGK